MSLSELAQGDRPNISLKLVSSLRLLLALGGPLQPGLEMELCSAVACSQTKVYLFLLNIFTKLTLRI